jgi:membrane protein
VSSLLERADAYFRRELWRSDLADEPFWRAWPLHVLRCLSMAVERGIAHQLPIRASALTFITVLSLVPSLAFVFSVAKSLGAYEQVRTQVVDPFLSEMFVAEGAEAPQAGESEGGTGAAAGDVANQDEAVDGALEDGALEDGALEDPARDTEVPTGADGSTDQEVEPSPGAQPKLEDNAAEAAVVVEESEQQLRVAIEKVLEFVEKTDVKRLGALGFLVVVYAVIRLLGGVEAALNLIWSVDRPRRFIRKVTDYLAIVIVTPMLAGLALTSGAALSTTDSAAMVYLRDDLGLAHLVVWFDLVLPLLSMWVVFTLIYILMPNTRVKLRSALFGGLAAALLWTVMLELYVKSQVGMASYNALYASFAAFPIFLLWLWFSWLVVLAGAEVGYADQHARAYRRQALAETGNRAWFELNILRAVGRIVGAFQVGKAPPTLEFLVDDLGVPESELESGLVRLERAGLLLRSRTGEDSAFALARPADEVSVHEALQMLRGDAEAGLPNGSKDELDSRLREAYLNAVRAGGESRSLADVAKAARTEPDA